MSPRGIKQLTLLACFAPLILSACGGSSTSGTALPSSTPADECTAVRSTVSAADSAYHQVMGSMDKSGIESVMRESTAKYQANQVLLKGFARLWPKTNEPDLKQVLKDLSAEKDWSANWSALQGICGVHN